MKTFPFTHRLATESDLPALRELMNLSINENQKDFLSPRQIEISHRAMGLDTQLIADRTYFAILDGSKIVGCGGWSYRSTLYGGDHSLASRNAEPLDPAKDAARVRAMYTHPEYQRRGIGRKIMDLCEAAAANAGFTRIEMMATLAGIPLYEACGYAQNERVVVASEDGVDVFCVRMDKNLIRNAVPF